MDARRLALYSFTRDPCSVMHTKRHVTRPASNGGHRRTTSHLFRHAEDPALLRGSRLHAPATRLLTHLVLRPARFREPWRAMSQKGKPLLMLTAHHTSSRPMVEIFHEVQIMSARDPTPATRHNPRESQPLPATPGGSAAFQTSHENYPSCARLQAGHVGAHDSPVGKTYRVLRHRVRKAHFEEQLPRPTTLPRGHVHRVQVPYP